MGVSQRSIFLGTVLGDAHLKDPVGNRQSILYFHHGLDQENWLRWKVARLGRIFTGRPVRVSSKRGVEVDSRAHPWLTRQRARFYCRPDNEVTPSLHKKMITQEMLDIVDDLALAVWWCDDGSNFKREDVWKDSLAMVAGALSDAEYYVLNQWFEKQGFNPSMYDHRTRDSNCVVFYFKGEGSWTFSRRIVNYVPECMRKKLGSYA